MWKSNNKVAYKNFFFSQYRFLTARNARQSFLWCEQTQVSVERIDDEGHINQQTIQAKFFAYLFM